MDITAHFDIPQANPFQPFTVTIRVTSPGEANALRGLALTTYDVPEAVHAAFPTVTTAAAVRAVIQHLQSALRTIDRMHHC